ncbi:MAG: MarR family transcriptional regulator [Bacteroidales bacterium]|nr:MarR family transcriptional regulator [Bacteroidales bacterium]MBN2697840.1 MarR family transcriptional regulator [Bacteroidales bacterium]
MVSTEVLIKIRQIVRSINLESKRIWKEYGVSIPQVLCLSYLQRSPNYMSTQGSIRKFLNLNSSTVSGIINRLEKKGLLARLPRSGDKRIVQIVLTSEGDRMLSRIPPLLHEQLSENLQQLDPDELASIMKGLDKLVGLLNIRELEATPMIVLDDDLEDIKNEYVNDEQ